MWPGLYRVVSMQEEGAFDKVNRYAAISNRCSSGSIGPPLLKLVLGA